MWRIRHFDEIGSTNTLAKGLLATGEARHGDVLTAHHQTAGRGRLGNRDWIDTPGESLLMTVVLEHWALAGAELAQYVCALAVLDALRTIARDSGVTLRLKWPNDVLLNDKKVCGVLSEAVWHANYLRGIVLGIGVNVSQASFPESIPTATSLKMSGINTTVDALRDAILKSLETTLQNLETIPEHLARLTIIGSLRTELEWLKTFGPLTLHSSDGAHRGLRYNGITELAFLILDGANGEVVTTNSGSLEIAGMTDPHNEKSVIY